MGTLLAFFVGWFLISVPTSLIIGTFLAMKDNPNKLKRGARPIETVKQPSFSIN